MSLISKNISGRRTPKLIVVIGETASGKSKFGLEVAKQFNGEIIAADALTVRRELDIGTAKPIPEEQKQVRHHLLDVVGACEDFTAAVFKGLAQTAIEDISARGKLPIIVGGTGLYVDAVLFNFSFLPTGDRKARKSLNLLSNLQLLQMCEERGYDLAGIDTRNKRRLIRVLESGGLSPTSSELRPNTLIIGLKIPRATLRANIEKRVVQMFKRGLKYEVKELVEKYGWDCEGLKGIGYREWQPYFNGDQSLAKTRRQIVQSTLNLAKRQRTWFKRNRHIKWIQTPDEAIKIAQRFLK